MKKMIEHTLYSLRITTGPAAAAWQIVLVGTLNTGLCLGMLWVTIYVIRHALTYPL